MQTPLTPSKSSTDDDKAREAAWSTLKPQLDPKGWTAAESFNFHGFFAWGWEARRQYDAAPTPEAEPLCPRPINSQPDSTTMAECILAGECGCTVKGHEYAQRKASEPEPVAFRMRHHLETEERDWSVMPIRFLERNKHPVYVIELLYTKPSAPSPKPDALDDVLAKINALNNK